MTVSLGRWLAVDTSLESKTKPSETLLSAMMMPLFVLGESTQACTRAIPAAFRVIAR